MVQWAAALYKYTTRDTDLTFTWQKSRCLDFDSILILLRCVWHTLLLAYNCRLWIGLLKNSCISENQATACHVPLESARLTANYCYCVSSNEAALARDSGSCHTIWYHVMWVTATNWRSFVNTSNKTEQFYSFGGDDEELMENCAWTHHNRASCLGAKQWTKFSWLIFWFANFHPSHFGLGHCIPKSHLHAPHLLSVFWDTRKLFFILVVWKTISSSSVKNCISTTPPFILRTSLICSLYWSIPGSTCWLAQTCQPCTRPIAIFEYW